MFLGSLFAAIFIFALSTAFPQDLENDSLSQLNVGQSLIQKKIDELKNLMENEVHPILASVHGASLELNEVIENIQKSKKDFDNERNTLTENLINLPGNCLNKDILQNSLSLGAWNFNSCGNFTDDCLKAAQLVFNGSKVAVYIGFTSANIVTDVMNCPSFNIYRAYKCYMRNIDEVKDLIAYAKKEGLPLIEKARSLSAQLNTDFKSCMGLSSKLTSNLQQHLALTSC